MYYLRALLLPSLLVFSLPAFSAEPEPPVVSSLDTPTQVPEDSVQFEGGESNWRLTGGYQWRQIGTVNFQSGTHVTNGFLRQWERRLRRGGSSSRSSTGPGSDYGPFKGAVDRFYRDGYVRQDADSAATGWTWFWGYDNVGDSQLASGTNVFFHADGGSVTQTTRSFGERITPDFDPNAGWESDLTGSGWFLQLETPEIYQSDSCLLTIDFSYSFAQADDSRQGPGAYSGRHREGGRYRSTTTTTTVQDFYDNGDIGILPSSYQGTFAGPGREIRNAPTSRTFLTTTTGSGGPLPGRLLGLSTTLLDERLEVDLHTLSLGPNVVREWKRLRLNGSVGLALNIVDWKAQLTETLLASRNGSDFVVVEEWTARNSGTDVVPGIYLDAAANYALTTRWSLFASGRYDWAGSLSGSVGPSSFSLDLGGWTLMGGLTFVFP